MQSHKGITKALLVTGDLVTYSTSEIDQLGVLANLRALINLATDISKSTWSPPHLPAMKCLEMMPSIVAIISFLIRCGLLSECWYAYTHAVDHVGSTCQDISLSPSADSRVLVRPLGSSILIVSMRKSANSHKYREYIDNATTMLEKGKCYLYSQGFCMNAVHSFIVPM